MASEEPGALKALPAMNKVSVAVTPMNHRRCMSRIPPFRRCIHRMRHYVAEF